MGRIQPRGVSSRYAHWTVTVLLGLILFNFALLTHGLGNLRLWGDSAYSVYSANQDLPSIIFERLSDGHPPAYYLLLHFWVSLVGNSELAVRFLSVVFGVLSVPLVYVVTRRVGGVGSGLLGALFTATSPMLVYYSRLPRMYSLIALLSLLSFYLFDRAYRERGRRLWLGYALVTLMALYAHYFTILVVLTQELYFLWLWQRSRRFSLPWLTTQVGLGVAYFPWLLFAALSQAKATASIISNAPPATGLGGFLQQVWLPFNVGVTLDVSQARPLSLLFLPLWLLGFLAWWRRQGSLQTGRTFVIAVIVPIILSYLLFLFVPYAVRPRFLIISLLPYLVSFSVFLGNLRYVRRLLLMAATGVVLAANAYVLADTYFVEARIQEPNIIRMTEYLEDKVRPGDAVVFHAGWQIGYFISHFRGQRPPVYILSDLPSDSLVSKLAGYKRVWLLMHNVPRRHPDYPLEEGLDRNWHKALELDFTPNRLNLYAAPLEMGQWSEQETEFTSIEGEPLLRLEKVGLDFSSLQAGDSLRIGLEWKALSNVGQSFTFFLHLLDAQGNLVAGRDREPTDGINPTSNWIAGDTVIDRVAMLIPAELPAGDYSLVGGFYPTGTQGWPRLPVRGSKSPEPDTVYLGLVQVEPLLVADLRLPHRLEIDFQGGLRLLGYATDLDYYRLQKQVEIHPMIEETVTLSFRQGHYYPGGKVDLTLYWQAREGLGEDLIISVRLLTKDSQVIGRHKGQSRRGPYVTSAAVVVDRHVLEIDPGTAPGNYHLLIGVQRFDGSSLRPLSRKGVLAGDEVELQRLLIGFDGDGAR